MAPYKKSNCVDLTPASLQIVLQIKSFYNASVLDYKTVLVELKYRLQRKIILRIFSSFHINSFSGTFWKSIGSRGLSRYLFLRNGRYMIFDYILQYSQQFMMIFLIAYSYWIFTRIIEYVSFECPRHFLQESLILITDYLLRYQEQWTKADLSQLQPLQLPIKI